MSKTLDKLSQIFYLGNILLKKLNKYVEGLLLNKLKSLITLNRLFSLKSAKIVLLYEFLRLKLSIFRYISIIHVAHYIYEFFLIQFA